MLATALAPAPSGSLHIASDLAAAHRVRAADTDAVLVRRTLPPEVAEAAVARARFGPVLQLRYAFTLAQLDAEAERGLFAPLGDGALAEQLRRDAARLARLWGELTGRERAVATLKLVDGDECTRLHADYVDLRVLCTYCGPGTWVARDSALDDPPLVQASAGDLVFLKGRSWPAGARGAKHRSPALQGTGERRLVLRVDALQLR